MKQKMNYPNPMYQWFMYLFQQRMDTNGFVNCFECGKSLYKDLYMENSCCYSHILGKKQYQEHAGNPNNVEITCPDCHNLYTMTPKKAKKQYNKYLNLKQLYYEI